MIMGLSAATILTGLLALLFLGASIANFVAVPGVREGFARWGYPPYWNLVTGGLELLSVVLIAVPASTPWGLLLGALVCLAALGTVVRHREYAHAPPALILLALVVADFYLLHVVPA